LAPGVAAALEKWRGNAPDDAPVFVVDDRVNLVRMFRRDLARAGVRRPELTETTENRRPIRVHDLRATFVTLALAAGRSEAWVSDRTGHRSSVMIHRYHRQARTAAELGLGELAPLNTAIPELRPPAPSKPPPAPPPDAPPNEPGREGQG